MIVIIKNNRLLLLIEMFFKTLLKIGFGKYSFLNMSL